MKKEKHPSMRDKNVYYICICMHSKYMDLNPNIFVFIYMTWIGMQYIFIHSKDMYIDTFF